MPMTRTKRLAGEPLLSLSSTKQPKRRKIVKNVNSVENVIKTSEIEELHHVCSPRCSALSSTCQLENLKLKMKNKVKIMTF